MGMRTDGIGVEFSKSWKHTTLESFCLDQEIYVVVGRDKMPGPDATKEGGRMGLILRREPGPYESIIFGTPVQTAVIYEMLGPGGFREDLDVRRAMELPPKQRFCIN